MVLFERDTPCATTPICGILGVLEKRFHDWTCRAMILKHSSNTGLSQHVSRQEVNRNLGQEKMIKKNASMTCSGASSLASCSSTKVATFFSNLGPRRSNQWIGIETWQQVSKYQLLLHGFCAADSPSSEALTAGSVLSSWQWECPFHQCLFLPFLPLPFPLQKNIGQQLGSCESRAKIFYRKEPREHINSH